MHLSLQNQSFKKSGRPEFPNFLLQAFSLHFLYQKRIMICNAKSYYKHIII